MPAVKIERLSMDSWRMPPLNQLAPVTLSTSGRLWMLALRSYLMLAMTMVIYKVIQTALA